MSAIDINRYRFSDGSIINYTPAEFRIMEIIRTGLGYDHMPSRLNIRNFYNDRFYSESTIRGLFSVIFRDIMLNSDVETAGEESAELSTVLLMVMGELYNDVGYDSLDYMFTIALPDMLEISEDRRLIDATMILRNDPTQDNVLKVYEALDDIMHDDKYVDNKVAYTYVAGLVNKMQSKQCYGSRGFVINLDGVINKVPVINSYLRGLYDNYEHGLDSKSASVALYYSGSAIRRSETFSNALQTACSFVENASRNDCGTKEGMLYQVNGPSMNKHGEFIKGDLDALTGMMYKLHQDDDWLLCMGDESELYGKVIILRMAWNCKHSNRHTVCVNCLGRLSLHSNFTYNIGLYLTTRLSDLLNQMILSAKHLISSAIADRVILKEEARKFLLLKNNRLLLAPEYINRDLVLEVSLKQFYGYKDLEGVDIRSLNHHRLSRIKEIGILVDDVHETIDVSYGGKTCIFTKDFLAYITKNTIEVTNRLVLRIDMKRWRKSFKLLEVPETMFDVRAYNTSIRNLITGNTDDTGKKLHKMSREEFIVELHEAISRKFTVSFTTLGLITYVMGSRDPKNFDFTIAAYDEPYTLTSVNMVLSKGSLSGAYSTGRISPLNNVDTYSDNKHMDHLIDIYLSPFEVVELEREGYFKRD